MITLDIGDDVVRISVGRVARAEAYGDDRDVDQIVSVISAVDDGGVEELDGSNCGGLYGFVGYRIVGAGVEIMRRDDAAEMKHCVFL